MENNEVFYSTKFVETMKEFLKEKDKLIKKQKAISEKFPNAKKFFEGIERMGAEAQARDVKKGIDELLKLIDMWTETENEIRDIDIIMISILEMYLGDFVIYLETQDAVDDSGKRRAGEKIFTVPVKNSDEVLQITPEDIYTLKLVKAALSPSSVRVIRK